MLNPKIDELKSLAFIYASLWVSYSHEKNLKIELEHIEDICDPIFLSRIVKKSKDISNKNKFYEKEFRKIIDSKERVLTLSEKSDLLDKISLVAAVDGDLHQNEKKVLYAVAKILDLPKNRFLVIDSPPIVLPGRLSHYPKVIEKYSLFYRGVVDNNYKYIWRSDGNQYLYKRDQYEDEANNIISSNVEISKDMHNKMLQYYESIKPDFQISKYPINIGPTAASLMTSTRIRKELKKLGYF